MRKIYGILIILSLILLPATSSYAQELKKAGIVEKEIDLGWITPALSLSNVTVTVDIDSTESIVGGQFYLHNYWNFTLNCGAHLPVNLSIKYPTEIVPGENLTVNISVKALPGFVFLNLSGIHRLNVTFNMSLSQYGIQQIDMDLLMMLLLENVHELWQMIYLETPIGEQNITTSSQINNSALIDLYHIMKMTINKPITQEITGEGYIDEAINTYVTCDVTVVAKTRIIGYVIATGTALEGTVNKTIEWTEEGIRSVDIPIRPDASPTDTVELSVELKYVVEKFYIKFSDINFEAKIDKEKIGEEINETVSRETGENQRFGPIAKQAVESVIEKYYKSRFPVNITSVGESKPMYPKIRTQEQSNELTSTSPYEGEETTLLSEAITIGVQETLYTSPELYIMLAIISGVIIVAYIIRRRNLRKE